MSRKAKNQYDLVQTNDDIEEEIRDFLSKEDKLNTSEMVVNWANNLTNRGLDMTDENNYLMIRLIVEDSFMYGAIAYRNLMVSRGVNVGKYENMKG